MNQPSQAVIVEQPSNGLGTAGFICSLIGFLTCGTLSPLGLLFSLIAVFKRPRGFAIAGLILGLLGSWFFIAIGLALITGAMGVTESARQAARDAAERARIAQIQADADMSGAIVEGQETTNLEDSDELLSPEIDDAGVADDTYPPDNDAAMPDIEVPARDKVAEIRTWTSSNGKFSIEAIYKSFDGTTVFLELESGESRKVPINMLSGDDQAYVLKASSKD